jgi:hypothetical protein
MTTPRAPDGRSALALLYLFCVVIAVTSKDAELWLESNKQQTPMHPPPRASNVHDDAFLTQSAAGMDVECVMRQIAYDKAMTNTIARRHSSVILQSLNASACPDFQPMRDNWTVQDERKRGDSATERHCSSCCEPRTIYVDCESGNDDDNNTHGTCIHQPLKTLQRAQQVIRSQRTLGAWGWHEYITIYLREGICYMNETFVLAESNAAVKAYPDEKPILSGGTHLSNAQWSQFTENIWMADIPAHVNISAIDGLFSFPHHSPHQRENFYGKISSQIRLTRARYPNGNSELDRMPTNYDKLGGSVASVESWKAAGNVSVRFPGIVKQNSSFYPWFGHSRDTRWVQDYHLENASSYYGTQEQFWQPRIATAVLYRWNQSANPNAAAPSFRSWGFGYAVMHVIHYSWWGNWMWQVSKGYPKNNTFASTEMETMLEFGRGGWQDAHGGAVSHNYFFIENVLEELDSPGEFYVDREKRKLYYWPLSFQKQSLSDWEFVVTQIPVIVSVKGTIMRPSFETVIPSFPSSSAHLPVQNVLLEGITFAHTTTTFLDDRYIVPSAGDWSVLPKGAVTIQEAVNVTMDSCSWMQLNGNGVALYGMVHNASINRGDFVKIGDSGIVCVGRLPSRRPFNGIGVRTYPINVTISNSHFGQVGVYGKQTSALLAAISKAIKFFDNVLYDGPRAGININDGFAGGHVIARNTIFNFVLESGDHGPINTWSRSAYVQESSGDSNVATVIPEWNYIDKNFIMIGPKFGALYGPGDGPCSNGDPNFLCPKNGGSLFSCLDHDDGSEYYLDTRNVCAFAGMKNYIGQNKIWDSNLIVFPEGAASQNRSGTSCIWTSMDMAGDKDMLPCSNKPCRTLEVFTNNTCLTYSNTPLEYDMFNETDLQLNGNTNTTIPFTARNQYYLNQPYSFLGKWNLSMAQSMGIDQSSKEATLKMMPMRRLDWLARRLLDLSELPERIEFRDGATVG